MRIQGAVFVTCLSQSFTALGQLFHSLVQFGPIRKVFVKTSTCQDGYHKTKEVEHLEQRQVLQLVQLFVWQRVEE